MAASTQYRGPVPFSGFDPGAVLGQARRLLGQAPEQLAEGFAQLVRSTPQRRLEQVMLTPVRRPLLDAIFWQMPQHLDTQAARGMRTSVRWRITGRTGGGADVYQLEVENGACRVHRGEGGSEPNLTITLDASEFVRLATANSNPIQAYFKGRIAVAGDVMMAARLQSLFRVPGRRASPAGSGGQPVSTVSSSRYGGAQQQ